MADRVGGRGGRCMHEADGRTGGWPLTRWSGGRADERTGGRGRKAADGRVDGGRKDADSRADGRKRREQGPGGADGAQYAWTGRRADKGSGGQADGWTGRSGPEEPQLGGLGGRADGESAGRANWGGQAYWQSAGRADRRTGGQADERVGLGLKGHIP